MPHNEPVARVPLAPFGTSSNPRAGLTGEARQPLDIDAVRMAEILQNATEQELSTLETTDLAPFVMAERLRRGAGQFPGPPPAAPQPITPGAQAAEPTAQRQLTFRMSPEPRAGAAPTVPTAPARPTQPSTRPPNVMPPLQGPSPQPQALGTMPQPPSQVGAAAQPQQMLIQPSPPRDEADLQRRTQGWQTYFSSPEVQAALLQFAIAIGQPIPPGQTGFGHGLQAVGAGAQAAGRITTAEQERTAAERAEELERRKVVTGERRAGAAEVAAEAAATTATRGGRPLVQAFTNEAGNRIVTLFDTSGNVIAEHDLGSAKDSATAKFNFGEFKSNLALRALGESIEDPAVQALTEAQAKSALTSLRGFSLAELLFGETPSAVAETTPTVILPQGEISTWTVEDFDLTDAQVGEIIRQGKTEEFMARKGQLTAPAAPVR